MSALLQYNTKFSQAPDVINFSCNKKIYPLPIFSLKEKLTRQVSVNPLCQ